MLWSSYLPLCVHLQNIHHIDHDVFVGFLVFAHSQRHSEPTGSTCAHVSLSPLLPPLTHLKGFRHMIQGRAYYLFKDRQQIADPTLHLFCSASCKGSWQDLPGVKDWRQSPNSSWGKPAKLFIYSTVEVCVFTPGDEIWRTRVLSGLSLDFYL